MRHDNWLKRAQRLARTSSFYPYKMACIIVRNSNVISTGINKSKLAESKNSRYDAGRGIHAELAAVLARYDVSGGIAYIAGLSKANNIICSKPCELCFKTLLDAGIKTIYYQDKLGNTQEQKIR